MNWECNVSCGYGILIYWIHSMISNTIDLTSSLSWQPFFFALFGLQFVKTGQIMFWSGLCGLSSNRLCSITPMHLLIEITFICIKFNHSSSETATCKIFQNQREKNLFIKLSQFFLSILSASLGLSVNKCEIGISFEMYFIFSNISDVGIEGKRKCKRFDRRKQNETLEWNFVKIAKSVVLCVFKHTWRHREKSISFFVVR